jgi:polysaccharide export outer membrane protein
LIPWDVFAQGEYVGPARLPHVHEYRLRVDDLLDFVFRLTGSVTPGSYRFNVGDVIRVESLTAEELAHPEVIVEPDGMITLRMLGPVRAAGRTSQELRTNLDELYKQNGFEDPTMTVTPVKLNTTLEELRATIDSRYGAGGQQRQSRVTPEGTIQLPALGSVPVQGLTLDELKRELNHRYQELVQGIEITPILVQRAPRFIYVVGEVRAPGRYVLEGPTSVVQSIALAGGWNVGGNLHQVVIFRRTEDWNLLATRLDLHGALLGKRPCPASEIWLRDTDIVIVPKQKILVFNEFVHLVFTHGVYGVIPLNTSYSFDRVGRL